LKIVLEYFKSCFKLQHSLSKSKHNGATSVYSGK